MTVRTLDLKRVMPTKGLAIQKEENAPARMYYRPGVKICLERGRLLTESYKETEGEPEVIRRAKALTKILDNITIYISDNELIVGSTSSSPSAISIHPELATRFLEEGVNNGWRSMLDSEDEVEELLDICSYWHGRSIEDRVMAVMPDDLKDWVYYNGVNTANNFSGGVGFMGPDHGKVLQLGLNGIINQIEERLGNLKSSARDVSVDDYIDQQNTLEAMRIACEAVSRYIKRFAELARRMAGKEADSRRKKELEKIAEICSWVSQNTPRTLYEALQLYNISHSVNQSLEHREQGAGCRGDVMFYPFYKRDIEGGRITREEAQELVECLILKQQEIGLLLPREMHGLWSGAATLTTITIGGVTPDGDDASNEFTLVILDAAIEVMSPHWYLILRYHPKINPEVVSKTIDCIRTGVGYPAIFNDSAVIPLIVNKGIPLEVARNWAIGDCVTWTLPGKCMRVATPNPGGISLGKCLELALNQGEERTLKRFMGKQSGYPTPDPKTFTSFEDVMQAYLKQVEFIIGKMAKIDDIAQVMYARYHQRPYASVLIDDCIEKGKDCTTWRYTTFPSVLIAGIIDVADSMAAIKKFVFDDKVITLDELLQACRNNFEGQEELRQRLINKAPKFGNDDDYADLIAREVHHRSQKAAEKIVGYWGIPYNLDGSITGAHYPWGKTTGALPNGKKYKEPFADGSLSPSPGCDKTGPTAVIRSMGKVSPTFPELTNQRFMPQFLEGENKKLFTEYLRTWAELGNWHIQFNVVDNQTLLDAQAHPEKYGDLIVRVAGYSAYFVDLSKGVQDEIIKRIAQRF